MSRRFARGEDIRTGRWAPTLADRAWIRALYDGEVRAVDAALARFFERLRTLGLYDDSLIVFTVDHGEEFWDHGAFEHGQSLHDELVRVPLIVKPPGAPRGARSSLAVSNAAVAPTVLAICGLAPDAAEFSWEPLLVRAEGAWTPRASAPPASTDPLFFDPRTSIVVDGFKYVHDALTGGEELYDLAADPGEYASLAGSAPERLAACRAALAEHERRAQALRERFGIRGAGEAGLDDAALEMMRQLGYVR
jgi:arylsulfatase A-like enzyme